jgi:class 3 adenylate cyclase
MAPEDGDRYGSYRVRGFLFADLRDYTTFVEAHGDEAAAELLDAYRHLVREVVQRFGGAEIRTEGDSFYVVFPSASDAVRCGLAIVAAAVDATATRPERPITVGIGIHAGETAETEEGYVGSAVNIAARICGQAAPGEVLVSDTVRGLTRTSSQVAFTSRGRRRLKGIAEPFSIYAARSAEALGSEDAAATSGSAPAAAAARPGRRIAVMGGILAVIVALAGGAILVSQGLLAAGSGRPGSSSPTALGSGGPSASATAGVGEGASSSSPSDAPEEVMQPWGPIAAGRYRMEGIQGAPTITLAAGWTNDDNTDSRSLLVASRPTTRLTFLDPRGIPVDACGSSVDPAAGSGVADRWVDWLEHDAALNASDPVLRVFGGVSATQLDVTVVPTSACRVSSPASVAVDSVTGYVVFAFEADRLTRVFVLDTQPRALLVVYEAPTPEEFQLTLPQVEAILDSLAISPPG